jgi:hypothetical protein
MILTADKKIFHYEFQKIISLINKKLSFQKYRQFMNTFEDVNRYLQA